MEVVFDGTYTFCPLPYLNAYRVTTISKIITFSKTCNILYSVYKYNDSKSKFLAAVLNISILKVFKYEATGYF